MIKKIEFHYQKHDNWPMLAWLAECKTGEEQVTVHLGREVECRESWFCEAVWDMAFEEGNFDETCRIFGSGGRQRDNQVVFVSSGFTTDRLHSIDINGTCYVSNSLSCLASYLDLHVDPWYPWYYEDIASILDGLDDYRQILDTDRGSVRFTYYNNLRWDGTALQEMEKPVGECPFNDFESYREFLTGTLQYFSKNLQSAGRSSTWGTISTSSSGYDSLSVTLLAKSIDNTDVICVPTSRTGYKDSGIELVREMGLDPIVLERGKWREQDFAEVPFISMDACGRDAWLAGAGPHLRHKLLLTGGFGGKSWNVHQAPYRHKFDMKTPCGLSMSEYRLHAGFQHCPLPALGAEHLDKIHAINKSEEMKPWLLGNQYDRPIPRRLLESASIRRNDFGTVKSAITIQLFRRAEFNQFFSGTPSFRDYMLWIRAETRDHPPGEEKIPLTVRPREGTEVPLFRHFFPWALERSKKYYNEH